MNKIEDILKSILLQNISITIRGKPHIRGKILFYEYKDFYFKLKFENSKKIEIPFPYNIREENNTITFSYYNKHIHHNDPLYKFKMELCRKNYKNKFYNSTLVIKII